jgi:hypothetical protein
MERQVRKLLVAERVVHRLAGEIVVQDLRQEDEGVDVTCRRLDDRALFLRRRLGFADADIAGRGDGNRVGVSAGGGDRGLERGVFGLNGDRSPLRPPYFSVRP